MPTNRITGQPVEEITIERAFEYGAAFGVNLERLMEWIREGVGQPDELARGLGCGVPWVIEHLKILEAGGGVAEVDGKWLPTNNQQMRFKLHMFKAFRIPGRVAP